MPTPSPRRRNAPGALPAVRPGSDCERCRPRPVMQPANTVSSLAYAVAGAGVLAEARGHPWPDRPGATAVGWSLVAVGAGSVAYHGPGGPLGRWAHDASLLAMTGLVALADLHQRRASRPPRWQVAAVGAAAALAAHPRTSAPAQAVTAATACGAEMARHLASDDRGRTDLVAAGLLLGGLALQAGGRTGGPLCRPDSRVQPHAAWHVLSAAAFWLRTRPRP